MRLDLCWTSATSPGDLQFFVGYSALICGNCCIHPAFCFIFLRYTGKPRAATALEFLRVVKEIESRATEVTVPLLILHGEMDVVCDPEGSRMLYKNAGSTDKTLHVYPEMWHQLVGEPAEGVEKVFGDMFKWLDARLPPQGDAISG